MDQLESERSRSKQGCEVDATVSIFDRTARKLLSRNTLFVASSRLPQKLDSIPEFFAGLLKLAAQLNSQRDVLLTIEGTACHRFVVRMAELFDIPIVCLRIVKAEPADGLGDEALVVDPENRGADQVLALLADQMTVLSMRKNGNLHKAVMQRLSLIHI